MTLSAVNAATISLQDAISHVQHAEDELNSRFFERKHIVRGLVLAAIAREHVLLLGDPGTAKSDLTNAFTKSLGWPTFERLLARTTQPDELFGPFDLAGLDQSPTVYERAIAGYLPVARAAFLDEIFKANSAILNGLLTLVNERAYDNGTKRIKVPLEILIGASNEYPQDESLGALFDRFMLRFWVEGISDVDNFKAMLMLDKDWSPPNLDQSAIDTLRHAADQVVFPKGVLDLIVKIRAELADEQRIKPSDRRWRKAMAFIRASAALAGRSVATPSDLSILTDLLWMRHEQRIAILEIVTRHTVSVATQAAQGIHTAARQLIGAAMPDWLRMKAAEVATWSPKQQEIDRMINELDRLIIDEPGNADVIALRAEVVRWHGEIADGIAEVMKRSRRV